MLLKGRVVFPLLLSAALSVGSAFATTVSVTNIPISGSFTASLSGSGTASITGASGVYQQGAFLLILIFPLARALKTWGSASVQSVRPDSRRVEARI